MHMQTTRLTMPRQPARGFSLIELMVAIVIIGVLTAIALPAYKQYGIKGKRGVAQAQMMDIANRQEQFLLSNRSYAAKQALIDSGYQLPANVSSHYTYDIVVGTGAMPSYEITFTAIGAQASDGNLTLNSVGVKGPAGKW